MDVGSLGLHMGHPTHQRHITELEAEGHPLGALSFPFTGQSVEIKATLSSPTLNLIVTMDDGLAQSLRTIQAPSGVRRSPYNTTVFQQDGLSPAKDGSDNHTISISIVDSNSTFLFDYAIISSFAATASIAPAVPSVPTASTASVGITSSPLNNHPAVIGLIIGATITVAAFIALTLIAILYARRRRTRSRSEGRGPSPTPSSIEHTGPPTPSEAYIIEPYAFDKEEPADSEPLLSPKPTENGTRKEESRGASPVSRYSMHISRNLYFPPSPTTLDHSDTFETMGSPATISGSASYAGRRKGTFGITNRSASPVATVTSTTLRTTGKSPSERTFSPVSTFASTLSPTTTILSPQSLGSPQSFFMHPSLRPIPSSQTRRSSVDVVSLDTEVGTFTSVTAPPMEGTPSVYTDSQQQQPF
ncbi:hypothetical protein FRB98_005113 [Tulasnella sp. 332]|nr:hypothetical protein FRB98_005113 [Tulasnella sp. 332]